MRQTEFFLVLDHFLPLLPTPAPLTTQITKILKKWKKQLDISSFYTSVPKMTIIWYMVPGIWRFWTDRIFLSSWAIFLPFYPLRARKMKISKKMKKIPRDIIILHNCTKTHDQMLYCSWDMVRGGCNCYFSFWAIFCPFTPLTPPKKM